MTWQPPPRPPWVEAVNRGEIPPIADEGALDTLLAELALRGTTPDDALRAPLDLYLTALHDEANLTVIGRWMMRRFLARLLTGHGQITTFAAEHPDRDPIVEPLIVTGAPRTGTTILHALLAQDPAHRAPLGWELLYPIGQHEITEPLADRELRLPALITSDLDAIHEYSGTMTKECLSAMSFSMQSEELTSRTRVPTYARWLHGSDMRPAYEAHRLVLQILQRGQPPRRWTLKSPVHLHDLALVWETYPNAKVVITHRDPLTILPSVTSLIATLRWAHSDDVDFAEIARFHADLYQADLDRLADAHEAKALDPSRVHHVRYDDFMIDPLLAVRGVYDHFGWTLSPQAHQRMTSYLGAHPQGGHGTHRYAFGDLQLNRTSTRARFARYQAVFAVPEESSG